MLILLQASADKISVITSTAAALDVFASFADTDSTMLISSNVINGNNPVAITSAATTDIVSTPGTGLARNLKFLSLYNKDASLSDDVTVQLNRSATLTVLFKCTLLVGERLVFSEGNWFHYDANGGLYGAVQATHELTNFSTGSQAPTAATLTQLTGSSLAIPTAKMRIGTIFEWIFNMTKTAAGTALSTFAIRIGTANTTSDASICAFTKPAGTGVADEATCWIRAIVRGPLTASCILSGHFTMTHNLSATGHAVIPCVDVDTVSSGFDATVAGLFASLSITSGASDAITIQNMIARSWNLQP